jgi:hypothetical protein
MFDWDMIFEPRIGIGLFAVDGLRRSHATPAHYREFGRPRAQSASHWTKKRHKPNVKGKHFLIE